MIMPIQTCQNCVLGLQWNMKIKSKVENNNNNKTNKQTNKQTKKQEMIDKLKTCIKKQTHAERERKIQDLKSKRRKGQEK